MTIFKTLKYGSALCALTGLAACAPVNVLNGITTDKGFTVEKNIAYGLLPDQMLDIYTPAKPALDAPVVVFFYGGGWNDGSKDIYKFIGQSFTEAGYIVVIPNYRLYPDVIYPEFLKDAAKAVAFTSNRFERPLVLTGHSAGAHLAAMVAVDERYLKAEGITPCTIISGWAGLAGPYDFTVYEEPYLSIFPENLRSEMRPITYAKGSKIPALMITGDNDDTVDPAQTTRMAAVLSSGGTEARTVFVEGAGHIDVITAMSTILRKGNNPIRPAMMGFVGSHASPACAAP